MKRLIVTVLTFAMLLAVFAGCSSTDKTTADEPEKVETVQPQAEKQQEEQQEEQQEDPEEPMPGKVDYQYPMFEETLEFTMFYPMPAGPDSGNTTPTEDYPFWQHVRQELNVAPSFERTSESITTEKYNLMIAGGEMTDCILQGKGSSYSTGLDMAVEDDVYVDLTGLVEEYAPNYNYYLSTNEEVRKEILTDGGRVVVLSSILNEPSGVSQGMLVHTEKLAATGYELTDVVEDWIEIFKLMQQDGTPHPAATTPSGNCCNNAFYYAFGTSGSSGFMIDLADDSIYYDPISQGYREYTEFFRQLYAQEIIDPDFYNTFGQEYFMDGTYATWMGNYQDLSTFPANYGVNVTAVPPLHLKDSTTGQPKVTDYASFTQLTGGSNGVCITTSCDAAEDVLRFFDWFYSDEGTLRLNYGFEEGVSYQVLEDGSHQMMAEMLDRDPVSGIAARGMHTIFEGWGCLISGVQLAVETPAAVAANDLWSSADPSAAECMGVPSLVTLNAEESTESATIMADIETYVNSTVMQWYTCTAELDDAAWDEYVKTITDLGIDRVIEIYETAYARYLAK